MRTAVGLDISNIVTSVWPVVFTVGLAPTTFDGAHGLFTFTVKKD